LSADQKVAKNFNAYMIGLAVLCAVVPMFVILQIASNHNEFLGFSYWIIPDSVTHFELTRGLVKGEFGLQDFLASAGVPLYYSIFFELGIVGFIAANAILLTIGWRHFGIWAICVPLLLYPHYLQLLVLPSKDMMVLAVYFLALYYMLNEALLKAILVSLGAFFIRDGATFVLLPMIVATLLIYKLRMKPAWVVALSFFVGMAVSIVLEEVAAELFVVSRNLYALNEMSSESLRSLPIGVAYVARIFFNLTNMAFRLPFIDELGGISIASVFMYISGVSSLVCCVIAVKNIFNSAELKVRLISTYYFLSLFVISLNPFIQGRYQLPLAIVASVILFRDKKVGVLIKLYLIVVATSIIARLIYICANIPFPELSVNPVDLHGLVNG